MKRILNSHSLTGDIFDKYSIKRVSYIISTKDRPKYFLKVINNIDKLVTRRDELIVVDGSGDDETSKIVKNNRNKIDKYIHEPDLSPGHANNKAILICEGKYIKLITDDDIIYPRSMEKAIKTLDKHSEIDILECGGILSNKVTKIDTYFYKPLGINFGDNIDDFFKYRSNGLAIILRRKSLANIGLFPIDLIADATFLVNAFKAKAVIRFCRIKLYTHVIHTKNISARPEIHGLIYKIIKKNASRKYFLRYAINYYVSKYPMLRALLFPIIAINQIFKIKKSNKSKLIPKWDGGFS